MNGGERWDLRELKKAGGENACEYWVNEISIDGVSRPPSGVRILCD